MGWRLQVTSWSLQELCVTWSLPCSLNLAPTFIWRLQEHACTAEGSRIYLVVPGTCCLTWRFHKEKAPTYICGSKFYLGPPASMFENLCLSHTWRLHVLHRGQVHIWLCQHYSWWFQQRASAQMLLICITCSASAWSASLSAC